MEKNKDYEKRLGRRLREAYLKDYKGPVMSRDEFHRLIEAVGKKKKHNRTLIGLAAACVALCLVCGGFMTAISMRESASAGKDDETKTVQQGGSVVIGSGVSEDDQNVGVSTKTYTDIEDIPEDLREQINFLDSDEFELDRVKVMNGVETMYVMLSYSDGKGGAIIINEEIIANKNQTGSIVREYDKTWRYKGIDIFLKCEKSGSWYSFQKNEVVYTVLISGGAENEIETILNGLT